MIQLQLVETAAPKGADSYVWHTYNGARGMNIQNATGKRTARMEKGARFGLRQSSDGKKHRMITEQHGPTIVFSPDSTTVSKLTSVSSKAPLKSAKRKTSKATQQMTGEEFEARYQPLIKAVLARQPKAPVATMAYADYLAQAGKMLSDISRAEYRGWDAKTDKLAQAVQAIKVPKGTAPARRNRDAQLDAVVKSLQAQAKRYLGYARKHQDSGIYLEDAGDLLHLAVALISNDMKLFRQYSSFDTNIRDELSGKVWNYINNFAPNARV